MSVQGSSRVPFAPPSAIERFGQQAKGVWMDLQKSVNDLSDPASSKFLEESMKLSENLVSVCNRYQMRNDTFDGTASLANRNVTPYAKNDPSLTRYQEDQKAVLKHTDEIQALCNLAQDTIARKIEAYEKRYQKNTAEKEIIEGFVVGETYAGYLSRKQLYGAPYRLEEARTALKSLQDSTSTPSTKTPEKPSDANLKTLKNVFDSSVILRDTIVTSKNTLEKCAVNNITPTQYKELAARCQRLYHRSLEDLSKQLQAIKREKDPAYLEAQKALQEASTEFSRYTAFFGLSTSVSTNEEDKKNPFCQLPASRNISSNLYAYDKAKKFLDEAVLLKEEIARLGKEVSTEKRAALQAKIDKLDAEIKAFEKEKEAHFTNLDTLNGQYVDYLNSLKVASGKISELMKSFEGISTKIKAWDFKKIEKQEEKPVAKAEEKVEAKKEEVKVDTKSAEASSIGSYLPWPLGRGYSSKTVETAPIATAEKKVEAKAEDKKAEDKNVDAKVEETLTVKTAEAKVAEKAAAATESDENSDDDEKVAEKVAHT